MILRVSLFVAEECCSFSNVWASSICDVVPALVLCMYVVLFMPLGRLASMCSVKRKALLLVYRVQAIGKSMVAVLEYVVCFKLGTKDQDLWGSRLYDIMHILKHFAQFCYKFVSICAHCYAK
jgi:hypothetical protein